VTNTYLVSMAIYDKYIPRIYGDVFRRQNPHYHTKFLSHITALLHHTTKQGKFTQPKVITNDASESILGLV